jgi:hypothetical protein
MVASRAWTIEARDKIHNLNLSCKDHEEYYNTIVEDFIWQNEAFWDEKTRDPKYTMPNGKNIGEAYLDTANKITVGVGFNMSDPSAPKEWDKAFGGAISFDAVKNGTRILDKEEVYQLFQYSLTSRREELKTHFGDDWEKLKPNEKLAIEDMYFNTPSIVTKYKKGEKLTETEFSKNIKAYCATSDLRDLEKAVKEVRDNSNKRNELGIKPPGIENRRKLEAMMLSSHETPIYSQPHECPIPKNASLMVQLGETIVPRDSYKECFGKYLRKGVEINCEFFEQKPIPHLYIWRAKSDDRVRAEHQLLDGKMFDDRVVPPPPHGFGCRCHAERDIPVYINVPGYYRP